MNIIDNFLSEQGQANDQKIDAGDDQFPLVVDPDKDLKEAEPYTNRKAQVNYYAKDELEPYQGQGCIITRIIVQNGILVGYEIKIDGKTFLTPKKNIYALHQYVEDIFVNDKHIINVAEEVKHWMAQRDYYETSWDGIESFYLHLSSHVLGAAVECGKWQKYPSSMRNDYDLISWRLIFKTGSDLLGVVNCQSCRHDYVWTLNTTMFSTREIDINKLKFYNAEDLWIRSAEWFIATAQLFQNSGYDFQQVIQDMQTRLETAKQLNQQKKELIATVSEAFSKVTKKQPRIYEEPISICITKIELLPGQVSRYLNSDSYNSSLLIIHPKIIKDMNYVQSAMIHDLIHAANGEDCNDENHKSEYFNAMADALNLSAEFRK